MRLEPSFHDLLRTLVNFFREPGYSSELYGTILPIFSRLRGSAAYRAQFVFMASEFSYIADYRHLHSIALNYTL